MGEASKSRLKQQKVLLRILGGQFVILWGEGRKSEEEKEEAGGEWRKAELRQVKEKPE